VAGVVDLSAPLHAVTFCVVDLETTGSAAKGAAPDVITEIGIVKVRGGECLGTLQTLVNPGCAISPSVTIRSGITEAMVLPAPRIEEVLPTVVEFIAGSVLVGHNVRFDVSFLNEALERAGWPRLDHVVVDTLPLARRVFREEVNDCRLRTLADQLRLDHRPTHRALDDALATTDLLHRLLERAAAFGVFGLDDLVALPRLDAHPLAAKLRLTTGLPRTSGVYLFVDARGDVLYVGKATNLRQRVRIYFSTDERRKVGALLRELHEIRYIPCAHTLEAAVTEVRLIHRHQPRYNRRVKRWRRYVYVKLTLGEPFPRLSVVTTPKPGAGLYLGPLPSRAAAGHIVDAIHSATALRRCTTPLGRAAGSRPPPCTPAQLGVTPCPCAGTIDRAGYDAIVARVVRALTREPDELLETLHLRMESLAVTERYEEAADVRDRAAALASALRRQRRFDTLRRAGSVKLMLNDGGGAELLHGVLVRAWDGRDEPAAVARDDALAHPGPPDSGPLPRHFADELACVASWIDAHRDQLRPDSSALMAAWPA